MKTFNELQNGNKAIQGKAFLVIALILIITAGILNHLGVIDLSALNKR